MLHGSKHDTAVVIIRKRSSHGNECAVLEAEAAVLSALTLMTRAGESFTALCTAPTWAREVSDYHKAVNDTTVMFTRRRLSHAP